VLFLFRRGNGGNRVLDYDPFAEEVAKKGAEGGKFPGHGAALVFAIQGIDVGTEETGLDLTDILIRFDKRGKLGKITAITFNGLEGIALFHGKPAAEFQNKVVQSVWHEVFLKNIFDHAELIEDCPTSYHTHVFLERHCPEAQLHLF